MSKIGFKKNLTLLLIIIIGASNLFAQAKIHGQIKDKTTDEVLSFANIIFNNKQAVSNSSGKFSFNIDEDTLKLKISYVGYLEYLLDTIIKDSDINLSTIYLKEDTNTLSEVTITSGKYKKLIENATISIESIKPKFLEKNNTVTFDDILEKIPGVNYVDGQANIRGGSGFAYGAGSRVLVLIDNMPALQFDSGYPNWENIPIETIEKVEVMKGAGSALYGSAAMNGVINILPIYAKDKMKINLKSFYSFYDSPADPEKQWWTSSPYKYGFTGLFSKKIKKLDVVGSFFLQRFESYKEYCFNNYGRGTLKLDYHFSDALTIGINSNINSGTKVNFFYWKNSTSGAYQADTSAYAAQDKDIYIIDPYISYFTKSGGKHKIQTRIYSSSNIVSGDKSNKSISYYGEYQYQQNFAKYGLIITAGIARTLSNTNAELYGDTSYVANNTGIYLQTEKKLFKKLNIVAGARYESNKISGPTIIRGIDVSDKYIEESKPVFRIGANYKMFSHTNIRASWGQGFRYPTIAEKFTNTFSGALIILPNPDLQSETGHTTEIGIRQGLKISKFKGYIDASIFKSEYQEMIEFALKFNRNGPYFTAENIGNTIVKGFEISTGFKGKIKNIDLSFMGGYLNIDPKYKDFTEEVQQNLSVDYNILKYRYKESFKFDFEMEHKGFILGFGSSYNSFMEAVDKVFEQEIFIKGVKEYRKENNTGNNIYRMRLGYKYSNIGLLINVDNLFNREYSVRPGLMEAPRSFTFSLSYNLN